MRPNRKAGEHSTTMSLGMVIALIMVVAAIIIFYRSFGGLSAGMDEAKRTGFCTKLMKTRHSVNQVEVISWGDPAIGPAISGTSLFYVSPACGNMYTAPCNTTAGCQSMIRENIKRCGEMWAAEPETPRPCLTDLEINDTLPITTELCKSNANICGAGAECDSTGVQNSAIKYTSCPQEGDSVSIKYDKTGIILNCMGDCI